MTTRRALLRALATLPAAVLGVARGASPSPVSLPALRLAERRLANGLHVVSLPDSRSASVAVQVFYRVGAKDDPPGRSGFAHLFEHLMFKRTRHMKDEMFDRLTEDVGGNNNAYTSADLTAYQNEVPSNHLERLLWAEAERMSSLEVDQANFASERAVVQEEYRQGVLADPYGRLFHALPGLHYSRHPYRRPVIGSIEDLDRASLAEVRQFHQTYYRPDNAVLVVAGGFEPRELDGWIDRYFGPVQRPTAAIPRVNVAEPRRREARRATVRGPNVPLPALAVLWQGPPVRHRDVPALRVASALLSAGESSRFNEVLVYRQQLAQQVGFDADLYADAGMLAAYGIAAADVPLKRLETWLLAEIRRLARAPIADDELDKVRTQLLTSAVSARQTPQGQAGRLGQAVVLNGDVHWAERELVELQAVTADDVQRVLRHWVLQAPPVTVSYVGRKGAK